MLLFFIGFIVTTTSFLALNATIMTLSGLLCIFAITAIRPEMFMPLLLGSTLALLLVGFSEETTQSLLLPQALWQKPIPMIIDIQSVLYDKPHAQSVIAQVISEHTRPFPKVLKLAYYEHTDRLKPGDRCSVHVKLKPIRGYSNPGGRDISLMWLARGVTAQGYLVNKLPIQCTPTSTWRKTLFEYRLQINAFMTKHVLDPSIQQLLMALAIGEKKLDEHTQSILQKTGTSHLLAISGLHVGLVGLMVYWLIRPLAKIMVIFKIFYSARAISAIGSLIAVILYIMITGNGVSSQRAGWMYTIGVILFLRQSHLMKMHLLLLVMSLMILLNTQVVRELGFWLSSSMVFILVILCGYRIKQIKGAFSSFLLQCQLSWVAFPLTLLLLKQSSLISPITNMIAIPVVSFAIVPLLLVFDCIMPFSYFWAGKLLNIITFITKQLWWFLSLWQDFPVIFEQSITHYWMAGSLLIALLLFMLPKGLWAKSLGIYFLILVLCDVPQKPPQGEVWLTWLDVGQGLSIVIQTAEHVLVYDTGPQYEDLEVASLTLMPFLKQAGIRVINQLMISHADNDHRGGIHRILNNFKVKQLVVGQTLNDVKLPQISCHQDKKWNWDGVHFEQWFVEGNWKSANNHSCILKISSGDHSVLLLGDLEREGEAALLLKDNILLKSNVISVPHHGSNTSSTMTFLNAVQPEYAIFSAGFLNSYHHPHPAVKARYDTLQVKSLDTGQVGAIRVTLNGRDDIGIICHRDTKC